MFPHFAAVDHDIVAIRLSLDLDLAKFDQSCFNLSMFRCLELKARDWRSKNVRHSLIAWSDPGLIAEKSRTRN
jgi:hypothetical protein